MTGHVASAEVVIDASPDAVWKALTHPDEIATWMMGTRVSTSWEVGSTVTWQGEMNGTAYEDKGVVLVYDEPHTLSTTHYSPLTGEPDEPESYHTVTYVLAGGEGGTTVTLSQDGNSSEEQAEQFSATWGQMLEALKKGVAAG